MNQALVQFAVDAVSSRLGLAVQGELKTGDDVTLELFPAEEHPNDSFIVRFSPGWRTAEADFIPGTFSAPLITQMGLAGGENRSAFVAFASALDLRKTRILFRVNGMDVSPVDAGSWPSDWKRLEIKAHSAPQVINPADIAQMRQLILDLVIPIFGMLIALIGVEEEEIPTEGEVEGRPIQTLITRYERKRVNREACIQLKGLRCAACGFEFADFYGPLGAGYIEVHHTIPISKLGPGYQINVSTDLEPLCSNCHAMVHKEDPPLSISRLRELIRSRHAMVRRGHG